MPSRQQGPKHKAEHAPLKLTGSVLMPAAGAIFFTLSFFLYAFTGRRLFEKEALKKQC